ncbi:MAG: hypothetical protein LRY36_01515 [Alphaproteobacteria bacterium]|nr:hypothetical protein [Alphaproteobacteria bacterium]
MPELSDDAKTRDYYQAAINKGLWTLEEAYEYITGIPASRKHQETPLISNDISIFAGGVTWVDPDENDIWHDGQHITDLVERHIVAGDLKAYDFNGTPAFEPIKIIQFFIDHTSIQIPQYLASTPEKTFITHTGLAGRPASSKQLLDSEFERRKSQGIVAETLAEEVRQLLSWLKIEHPTAALPAQGTTENNFRAKYIEYKKPRN